MSFFIFLAKSINKYLISLYVFSIASSYSFSGIGESESFIFVKFNKQFNPYKLINCLYSSIFSKLVFKKAQSCSPILYSFFLS